MTPDNRKFITWPATVKCDPQLSYLQHALETLKTEFFFQIENNPDFYHSKEELFVEQSMQFCFYKLSFQRDTLR